MSATAEQLPEADEPEIVTERPIEELINEARDNGLFLPGEFYDDIPNALYHAGPGCSSTNLKRTSHSPLHDKTEKDHPKASTDAMRIGTLVHEIVLEPDLFDATYVPAPKDAPKRPTERQINAKKPSTETIAAVAWWASWEAENAGKKIIETKPGKDPFWKPSEWDQIHFMRDAIVNDPDARCFLQNFIPERSMYWLQPIKVRFINEDGSVANEVEIHELAKCRFDAICLNHNMGVDIKTCVDASYSGFQRAIMTYQYHLSRNWYMRGAKAIGQELLEFVFIAAEKEPPYAVACYTVDQEHINQADMLIKNALEKYSRAIDEKYWPCYPEGARQIAMPSYGKFISIS